MPILETPDRNPDGGIVPPNPTIPTPPEVQLPEAPTVLGPPAAPPPPRPDAPVPGTPYTAEWMAANAPKQVGWTENDRDTLEFSLRSAFLDIPDDMLDETMQLVMWNSDPTILNESQERLVREIGMTTRDQFEDAALKRMLGVVDDDEAFAQAAIDTWLATGGAARTASTVFANTKNQATWFTNYFLEDKERRDTIIRTADERIAGNFSVPIQGQIDGLRGKGLRWVVDGNDLAMSWIDTEGDGSATDVLIHLDEGTTITSSTDAVIEYLVAENGGGHIISPTSGDVPGRRTWLGALFKGADNVIQSVERWGTSVFNETLENRAAEYNAALAPVGLDVTPERQAEATAAVRDQETRAAVERQLKDSTIIAIANRAVADNPDLAMSNAVAAGIAGWNEVPDDVKEASVVQSVQDLEAAATQKRAEQSRLGQIIEEDIAPPVYTALAAWDSAIQFIGIAALDLTNLDATTQLYRILRDEGIGALSDPAVRDELVGVLNPTGPDLDSWMREFNNVREEGLPKALLAYQQSVSDIGTVADYYGMDPESNFAAWVNIGHSVIFDPITYTTLGGNASWNALRKGVTTVEGAERLIASKPIQSFARQIVDRNAVHLIPIISKGNMADDVVSRLIRIATTTYEKGERIGAMQEALDLLRNDLPAYGGLWMPQGPARLLARKTTLGLAAASRRVGTDTTARSFVQDVLIRASKNRFVRINERNWLDEMFDMISVRRLNDTSAFGDDVLRMVDVHDIYKAGDDGAAMLQGRAQLITQELEDLSVFTPEVGQVPRLRGQIVEWNDSIKELDRRIAGAGDDATRQALETQRATAIANRDEIQNLVNQSAKQYDDRVKVIAQKRKDLGLVQAQMEELGGLARDRSLLEHEVHKYFDEWADEWGVPILEKSDGTPVTHPWFPDLPMRDWSVITGRTGTPQRFSEAESALAPFGADAGDLASIGMRAQRGITPIPVSINEFLAWHAMQRNATTRAIWHTMHETTAGEIVKGTLDTIQTAFASAVLLNIRTIFRSNIDEPIRFFEDAGLSVDALKSGATVTGKIGPEAAAFGRDLDGLFASGAAEWKMVSPSQRGMWRHAERWLNGTVLRDPITRAFGRIWKATTETAERRALWEKWWNETGSKLAKRTTVQGSPITAGNSYDIMENSFSRWVAQIADDDLRATAMDDIMSAAAEGRGVSWTPKEWRKLPPVPGEVATQTGKTFRHIMDGAFQLGYGAPQSRRGSVFFDHYYSWARDMYDQAYKGKILDEDWLINNGKASTRLEAQEILNNGHRSQVVRHAVAQSGMILEDDLHNAAIRWASNVADDMMYTFGAASMFGKATSRVYPFGRAQVDYLQWWWKKLTQPTQTPWGQLPVSGNIRLIDRMAHLANLSNPELRGDNNPPGAFAPAGVIDNLTFLPTGISEQTLIDVTPSASPMASWLLEAPFIPEDVRNTVLQFHPSNRRYRDTYSSTADWLQGLQYALFPEGGMTIRNQAGAAYRAALLVAAAAMSNYDPNLPPTNEAQRRLNATFNGLVMSSAAGPYRNDLIKLDNAQWLEENAFDAVPDLSDPESDLMRDWALRNERASIRSLQEDVYDFFGKIAGSPSYSGSDFQYVESLMPVVDYVNDWVESGSITDAKRDSILYGHKLILDGTATASDRLTFADEVLESLFTFLTDDEKTEFIANNPGVTANMVSYYEVKPGLVPDDVQGGVVGDRIRTNNVALARELRERGRDEGWLVIRDDMDVRYDMLVSSHRSFREYMDILYKRATGLDIGAQSFTLNGKKVSTADKAVTIPATWWDQHKAWIDRSGAFDIPAEDIAAWTAGQDVTIPIEDFKSIIRDAKGKFTYEYTISNAVESKMNRIGIDDRSVSIVGERVMRVPGFNVPGIEPVDTTHYGADLLDDFNAAVAAGQKYAGWSDLSEWDVDTMVIETKDDKGDRVETSYSKSDLLSRFRVAVALAKLETSSTGSDYDRFTEADYTSTFERQLGPLDWEPPKPPPLKDTLSYYETSAASTDLRVVDGDTLELQTAEGPVFVRLLGLNAPERGQKGYQASYQGLNQILDKANKVQLAIWDPDTYGLRSSAFTKDEAGAIVQRDRLMVWLYIDGVPLYDPSQFSPTNIRGVQTGGTVPDYEGLLRAQGRRGSSGLSARPEGGG